MVYQYGQHVLYRNSKLGLCTGLGLSVGVGVGMGMGMGIGMGTGMGMGMGMGMIIGNGMSKGTIVKVQLYIIGIYTCTQAAAFYNVKSKTEKG